MTSQRAVHGLVFAGFAALAIARTVRGALLLPDVLIGVTLCVEAGLANRLSRINTRSALLSIPAWAFGWYRSPAAALVAIAVLLLVFPVKTGDLPLTGFARTRALIRWSIDMAKGIALLLAVPFTVLKASHREERERRGVEGLLQHSDPATREKALAELSHHARVDSAPAFIKLLVDPEPRVARLASSALFGLRGDAVPRGAALVGDCRDQGSARSASRIKRVVRSVADDEPGRAGDSQAARTA